MVLALAGIADVAERAAMLDELYAHRRAFFVTTRKKEKATANRSTSSRRARVTPLSLAQEVVGALRTEHPALLHLRRPARPVAAVRHEGASRTRPAAHRLGRCLCAPRGHVTSAARARRPLTRHPAQQPLLLHLASHNVGLVVRLPISESLAESLRARHATLMRERHNTVVRLAAERTHDEKLRAAVAEKVLQMLPA